MTALDGSSVDERVWIRGEYLRESRLTAGLRLADVVGGIMSIPTLSRLEAGGTRHVPFPVVAALVGRMGIPLPEHISPQAWMRAVVDQGIAFLERGRFEAALRALRLRDLLVHPPEQRTEAEAQVLEEWASWHCGATWRSERMQALGAAARDWGAVRPWVWAGVCESILWDRMGAPEKALAIVIRAARVAEREGEPVDVLCARAAWGRALARQGKAASGLEIVHGVGGLWERGTLYGRARLLHARGVLFACDAQMEEARCNAPRFSLGWGADFLRLSSRWREASARRCLGRM